jgi:hypothetical protein
MSGSVALDLSGNPLVEGRAFIDEPNTFVQHGAVLVGHFTQRLDFLEDLDAFDRLVTHEILQLDQVLLHRKLLLDFVDSEIEAHVDQIFGEGYR